MTDGVRGQQARASADIFSKTRTDKWLLEDVEVEKSSREPQVRASTTCQD